MAVIPSVSLLGNQVPSPNQDRLQPYEWEPREPQESPNLMSGRDDGGMLEDRGRHKPGAIGAHVHRIESMGEIVICHRSASLERSRGSPSSKTTISLLDNQ